MIDYYGSKVRVKFNKGCLKQSNNLTYDYGSRVNIYIVYELGTSSSNFQLQNPRVSKISNGRTMVLSKCAICNSKKSRFIKNQEAKGLLSNLVIRTPLSKVPILGGILL